MRVLTILLAAVLALGALDAEAARRMGGGLGIEGTPVSYTHLTLPTILRV